MKYPNPNQAGFSLVETLVAITILLIIIVGPMKISSSTAKSTSFASEQIVASFLAQEGAELAQKTRDELLLLNFNNYNPQNGWESFSFDTFAGTTAQSKAYRFCYDEKGCSLELDPDPAKRVIVSNQACDNMDKKCALYFNDSPGTRARYTYDSKSSSNEDYDPTPYTREIFLEKTNPDEVRVISRVTWSSGNQRAIQTAEVETYLYNVYGS